MLVIDTAAPRASFLCECGRLGCDERVRLTATEYKDARAEPSPLVVARGHELRAAAGSA